MPELLLEILSEEIPARMQPRAMDDLKKMVTEGLTAAGLSNTRARAFATPRRLALVVEGIPEKAEDVNDERRGPRVDAGAKAIDGFLKSTGLTLEQLEKRKTDKGEFYFATIAKKGEDAQTVVTKVVSDTLNRFPWPKSMRWKNTQVSWVRPIHNVMCVLDGKPVDYEWDLGVREQSGMTERVRFKWNNESAGHRFHAPESFPVTGTADYRRKLKDAHVILDPEERKTKIKADAETLAKTLSLVLRDDPALLDEVAGLVEWPVALIGTIDDAFMDIPSEVLTATMRKNQKYFALETPDGIFASHFIVIANREAPDGGAAIVAGNERVLRARLADAKFFWDLDRKATLASRAPQLAKVTFHAKLGSLAQKMERVRTLATEIAAFVPGADKTKVRAAADLAKADLVSGMVGEFPEVQGVMGRYYALGDGQDAEVANAIREHYAPQGPSDKCPTAPVSVALGLADRVDTLAGFWAIGEKPTGSKDPFALRRAALGVIRLVLENRLRLKLRPLFAAALRPLQNAITPAAGADIPQDLLDFFVERLKVHLRDQGVRHDMVAAVFALPGQDDLADIVARVKALQDFLKSEDGANLLTAYKRAANILRIEEKRDSKSYDGSPEAKALVLVEERALAQELGKISSELETILQEERYSDAMTKLAGLRASVDAFFDHVTVNADDPAQRINRLKLLSRIRATMNQVADFSQIEGGER
jgi:glycyl-tRNA synthetase beta chain